MKMKGAKHVRNLSPPRPPPTSPPFPPPLPPPPLPLPSHSAPDACLEFHLLDHKRHTKIMVFICMFFLPITLTLAGTKSIFGIIRSRRRLVQRGKGPHS